MHAAFLQRHIVLGTVRHTGSRKENAQVVVDLGHRAHRRARSRSGRCLPDGNAGRKPFDGIHIGLIHHIHEAASVARDTFSVATLTFGIERVKRN